MPREPGAVVCATDGTELVPAVNDPLIGQLVGGYRISRRLGVGGMGAVYRAIEPTIERHAAVKILHPHLCRNPDLPTLLAEARAANAIGDDGIVDIYSFGQLPDGRTYLVMELLEGEVLTDKLRREGPLPIAEVVGLSSTMLNALEAAHAAGFVHRDIKPDNIFIVRRPHRPALPKLLDLGLARRITDPSGYAAGTPAYVAPEQVKDIDTGPKCDLYSLGCVMFEMLTGRVPFEDTGSIEAVLERHQKAPRPSARALRPEVPKALDNIVKSMMAVRPGDRPASAVAVRDALLALDSGAMTGAVAGRGRWVAAVAVTAVVAGTGAYLQNFRTGLFDGLRQDPMEEAIANAVTDITNAMDAGLLANQGGSGAVGRLLAAERSLPNRPEFQALRAAIGRSLRLEAKAALDRDDAEGASTRLDSLEALGALPGDDALAVEVRRMAFARRSGMVRVGAVYIDRYEYPNREGAVPTTGVDWADAVKLCEGAGKHLCTEEEWEKACVGQKRRRFAWGSDEPGGQCLTKGGAQDGPAPSGSHPGCVTEEGVFDLSGNVAEWTSSPLRDGAPQRVTRGGSFSQSPGKLACEARDYSLPGLGGSEHLGFRCCR